MATEDGRRIFWLCYGEYKGRRDIKPFLRYVEARFEQEYRDLAYRIYVTDAIGGYVGLKMRFVDLLKPVLQNGKSINEDNRSADEIAICIIKGAGLRFRSEVDDEYSV